jgi:hypothetical protein
MPRTLELPYQVSILRVFVMYLIIKEECSYDMRYESQKPDGKTLPRGLQSMAMAG